MRNIDHGIIIELATGRKKMPLDINILPIGKDHLYWAAGH